MFSNWKKEYFFKTGNFVHIIIGLSPVWTEFRGLSPVWTEFRGLSPVWTEYRGLNPVWAEYRWVESHMDWIPWVESRVGWIPLGWIPLGWIPWVESRVDWIPMEPYQLNIIWIEGRKLIYIDPICKYDNGLIDWCKVLMMINKFTLSVG